MPTFDKLFFQPYAESYFFNPREVNCSKSSKHQRLSIQNGQKQDIFRWLQRSVLDRNTIDRSQAPKQLPIL